jgi:Flp pilus assembly protein TadG
MDDALLRKHNMKRCNPSRSTERRGAVTVEFALVVPIILLLFFGALDLASMNFARHTIGFAAYEGARRAAIPGNTATHATTEAMRQMGLVGLGTGAVISVTQTNTEVTVSIQVPSSGFSWSPLGYFANYSIRETCTLRKE